MFIGVDIVVKLFVLPTSCMLAGDEASGCRSRLRYGTYALSHSSTSCWQSLNNYLCVGGHGRARAWDAAERKKESNIWITRTATCGVSACFHTTCIWRRMNDPVRVVLENRNVCLALFPNYISTVLLRDDMQTISVFLAAFWACLNAAAHVIC